MWSLTYSFLYIVVIVPTITTLCSMHAEEKRGLAKHDIGWVSLRPCPSASAYMGIFHLFYTEKLTQMTPFTNIFVYFLHSMLSRLAVNHLLVTLVALSTSARCMRTRGLLYLLLASSRWNGSFSIEIIVRGKVEM